MRYHEASLKLKRHINRKLKTRRSGKINVVFVPISRDHPMITVREEADLGWIVRLAAGLRPHDRRGTCRNIWGVGPVRTDKR